MADGAFDLSRTEAIPAAPNAYLPPPTRQMLWYAIRGWAMGQHVVDRLCSETPSRNRVSI